MNKFLITNYDYLNLWYDSKDEKEMLDKYHELKLSYKDNVQLLSKTHLGDYSIIAYYDDEVYMNWYKANRDKLVDWLNIKENEKFCYVYQVSTQPQYSYSQQAIDFIYDELRKAPNTLLDYLKEKCAKK